jgi:hypothetical protein
MSDLTGINELVIARDLIIKVFGNDPTDLIRVCTGRYRKGVKRSQISVVEHIGMYYIKMKEAQLEISKEEATTISGYFDIKIIHEED